MPCVSALLSGKSSSPKYMLMLLLGATTAQGTEGNGTAYPLGLDTVMAGHIPPPGLTTFYYSSAYESTDFKGNDGHKQAGVDDFHLSYESLAVAFYYVYPDVQLLGASVASRVAQPFINGQFSYSTETPQGRKHYSSRHSGFGDLAFTPLFLGWSAPGFNQMAGVDVYAPTGSYDKDRLFNTGTNVWSYSPWYSFTANPIASVEVSAKALYMINSRNAATAYRSGDELNVDYHLGYDVTKNLQVGLSGYLYKQVTDDRSNGDTVIKDGNRGQVFGWGPALKYHTPDVGIALKWQHETQARNRASGERIWLQGVVWF